MQVLALSACIASACAFVAPNVERPTPSTDPKAEQQALVPTGFESDGKPAPSETHGGEDVALFATGPGAEEAHGVIEQNLIHDIIMDAFGFGK